MNTNYAIHANGTFWGIFTAATEAEAIQMAADEHGSEGNTDGMTATEAGKHILHLRDACDHNDCDMTDLIRERFNCHEAEISEDGRVWISNPQTGHWLNTERLAEVIAQVERT